MTREDAKAFMRKEWRETMKGSYAEAAFEMAIKALEQPTIQPERKKGKWIDNETSYADGVRQTCTCSICGQRSVRPLGRFCRWCGADMGEDGD